MLNPIEGEIFTLDKALGMTSFAVVKKVRAVLRSHLGTRQVKVGHAGTLDPLATGVLLLCTGHATKRIDELQSGVKEYVADLKLGATTPSFDRETPEDASYQWQHIDLPLIEQVLQERFVGEIQQVPPAYSACKVDGKPAYKLARKGHNVAIRPKTLVIDEIEVLHCGLPTEPTLQLRIVCSKGTYIRALARDIGEALNSGAYLMALRRTRVGAITIDQCVTLDELVQRLDNEQYVSPEQAEQQRLEQERIANRARAAQLARLRQSKKPR